MKLKKALFKALEANECLKNHDSSLSDEELFAVDYAIHVLELVAGQGRVYKDYLVWEAKRTSHAGEGKTEPCGNE